MTRIELFEQSWRNLEEDIRDRLRETNKRVDFCNTNQERTYQVGLSAGYASMLDLIHTAMRELGLRHD